MSVHICAAFSTLLTGPLSIVSKLRELGWGEELDRISPSNYYPLSENALVRPSKTLTDRGASAICATYAYHFTVWFVTHSMEEDTGRCRCLHSACPIPEGVVEASSLHVLHLIRQHHLSILIKVDALTFFHRCISTMLLKCSMLRSECPGTRPLVLCEYLRVTNSVMS